MGEWFIKRMPLVKHIYSASKQISAAINPGKDLQELYNLPAGGNTPVYLDHNLITSSDFILMARGPK
jgi:hypothetical protein